MPETLTELDGPNEESSNDDNILLKNDKQETPIDNYEPELQFAEPMGEID